MNFAAYETGGRAVYAKLSETIKDILTAAISTHPQLRLQQIQHRAKDPASLRPKLLSRNALETEDLGAAVKDLAGCRLVFYTNSDVARFQSSRILFDNFEVDWARTKIHHPQPSAAEAQELFISNNYVIRLKDERLALPEYAQFRGLWCELQIQTTLNHAWSEMEHDMIYKPPESKGFGASLMEGIKKRMQRIMRDHLLPAGYEFQKVVDDFERLKSGKQIFDRGALEQLAACADNNARLELLERFEKYVLPAYDDLESEHEEIRAAVLATSRQIFTTERKTLETPFASLPGYTSESVFEVAARILDRIRYLDVAATFDAICTLYRLAPGDAIRTRLLKSAEELSEPKLEIWKQSGPVVQDILVEKIRALDSSEIESVRPVLLKMLGEILGTELHGSSATYKKIVLQRGAANASPELESIRGQAIDFLTALFRASAADEERRAIMQALSHAMQPPGLGQASFPLRRMLIKDTIRIAEFYFEVAPILTFELTTHVEHALLWQFRHKARPGPNDSELQPLQTELKQRIFAFRDRVNADQEFVIHKTLVGFESVFPPEWEGDDVDFSAKDAYRKARIVELVADVTPATASHWMRRVIRSAQSKSYDGADFISLGEFLELLGKEKPAIVLEWLENFDDRLSSVLPSLLIGPSQVGQREAIRQRISTWIEEGRYLGEIIWYERFASVVDPDLLEQALTRAKAAELDTAVLRAVAVAAARHSEVPGGLLTSVLIPAIRYLSDRGNVSWVNAFSLSAKGLSIISDVTSEQVDLLLTALVPSGEVTYRMEEVLAAIAKRFPGRVVDFFGERLQAAIGPGRRYEAVPYEFHMLSDALRGNTAYLVEAVRRWFNLDSQHFEYRGGRFLANIFPTLTPELEHKLSALAATGKLEDLEFVVHVLASYQGQSFIFRVAQDVVAALPAGDPLLERVSLALDTTGVLHGAFGLVEAYRQKRDGLHSWLEDSREQVRSFAKAHIYELSQMIAAEQRRSEEDVEFQKRSFPDPDPDPGGSGE